MSAEPVRLAMWSGPRNISTAMMRAFENRPDCCVVDEPFYGVYLARTSADHPGRADIIAAMDCDWRSVAATLCTELPGQCAVFYQKHMTHHMLAEIDLDFTDALYNAFLVRDPARVIASYARIRPDFTLEELGFPQQLTIFRHVRRRQARPPLVLNASDVLRDPETALTRLCNYAGIPFSPSMLRWPAGKRSSDGVWAPYWYAAVEASTGFQAADDAPPALPSRCAAMLDEALEIYQELQATPG